MTTTATVEDDAGLSDSEEKENPFIDFIGADYAANAATTTPQSSKTKTVARWVWVDAMVNLTSRCVPVFFLFCPGFSHHIDLIPLLG